MTLSHQQLERKVFDKFSKHIGINIVCFQLCNPPKPDILCETENGLLFFELTDNTSEKIQKSVHAKEVATRNGAYWFDPFPESFKQKFSKQYETNSIDCELVVYFGIHPVAELGAHFDVRLRENIEWIKQNIRQSEFQKVWIYDYHRNVILSCINVTLDY